MTNDEQGQGARWRKCPARQYLECELPDLHEGPHQLEQSWRDKYETAKAALRETVERRGFCIAACNRYNHEFVRDEEGKQMAVDAGPEYCDCGNEKARAALDRLAQSSSEGESE